MGIYFYGCITLDGYLADARHGLGWLDGTGSVEETSFDSFYKEMDITLMGGRSGPSKPWATLRAFTHPRKITCSHISGSHCRRASKR